MDELIEALRDAASKPYNMRDVQGRADLMERAAAALEAAREDAERWRWLRDVGIRNDWCVSQHATRGGVYQQTPESLDAAIDQARGKGVADES